MRPIVPFVDLARMHAPIRAELDAALRAAADRGDFIEGGELAAFEEAFARYCGVPHCVGVGSGLDALTLSLRALDIGPGDEVVTVANTFVATVFAIRYSGATPVLVDCDPRTHLIDPGQLETAITSRTRAILPVHLYGRLADRRAIDEIAVARGLAVIEDAAQAHGATRDGWRAGAWGRTGCFSFYPAKNLGAFGDGGAVTTADPDIATRLRALRSYGQAVKNRHDVFGVNSRLDTLQAAVLRIKLRRLDRWNAERADAARRYRERLAGLPIELPEDEPGAHVYHLLVVQVPERDRVRQSLAASGIQTGVHYPTPVHLQPACAELGYARGSFPVAEKLAGRVLSLPLFSGITDAEIDRVGTALVEAL